MKKQKIIIIGAGLSGLYTGFLLQKQGYEVTILEARNRVGGRSFTEEGVDLGGTWVSSKQPRIMKLCEQFGLKVYRQFEGGMDITYFHNERLEQKSAEGEVKFIPDQGAFERAIALFNELTKSPDFLSENAPIDKMTGREWFAQNILDEPTRDRMNWSFQAGTCSMPENSSPLFWLYFLQNSGGYEILASIKEGAQEFRIEGGSQTISIKLAENLNVIYNAPVRNIEKQNAIFSVTANGKNYFADKIISAIPVELIPQIEWNALLEVERLNFYKKMHMGKITKVVLQYERAFWRDNGHSGQICSDTPPIILSFDICNTKYNALVLFLIGTKNFTDDQILKQAAFLFNDEAAKSPTKIYRKNWSEDPYAGGCYFCSPEPNVFAAHQHYLMKPHNDIYFVGTETARHWMGYMEGALESAERGVEQIVKN
jgi:monoamine oxidase